MCNFKSAIVIRDLKSKGGFRLLMSPWTEHHSDLITMFNLKDDGFLKFARIEFSPDSMDRAYLPEAYKLKIDEERTHDWFDQEMKERVSEKMLDYIKSIIVTDKRDLLIGGQFIVGPGAEIKIAKEMVINAICGGTVYEIRGGTVHEICGGTVSVICGGTVYKICGGTVSVIWGGTVYKICGGTVSEICGGPVLKDYRKNK